MWWNFVGRSHDEIVEFRSEWQARSERFGRVDGYRGAVDWLLAPPLPHDAAQAAAEQLDAGQHMTRGKNAAGRCR